MRRRFDEGGPAWVAVAYADWRAAGDPTPDEVLEASCDSPTICGLLLDTWSKAHPLLIDEVLLAWSKRVREAGKFLAVAGSLNAATIPDLAGLRPDIVAVRGAACAAGNRRASIDPARVADLAELVSRLGPIPCRLG
jgi:uncharacterized protein (UPF0264 family)